MGLTVIASEASQTKKRGISGEFSSFYERACRAQLDCFASLAMTPCGRHLNAGSTKMAMLSNRPTLYASERAEAASLM
jgi:hypothetical protein